MGRRVLVIFCEATFLAICGCAPIPTSLWGLDLGSLLNVNGAGGGSDAPFEAPGVAYRSGSDESELDVWVTFTDTAWDRVRGDPMWATDTVIAILGQYVDVPQAYFATLPSWATMRTSWRSRIDVEIRLHCLVGDNDMHFSQWWISDVWPINNP